MTDILDDFYVETKKQTEKAILQEAKETASYLRATSPKSDRSSPRRGRYARGWRYNYENVDDVFVYNQTDWQLTHLLEDGHDVKNRFSNGRVIGHYFGDQHISKAEERAADKLPMRVSRGLH